MKKPWLTWLGLGAACAVCCAPLIAPLLASAGLAGFSAADVGLSLFGLSPSETLCVAVIVGGVAALAAFRLVRHRAAKKAAACACATPADAPHCGVSGACAPGERSTIVS